MLQWETVDVGAIYLFERCLAVRGNYEYRIFYGPDAATQERPWILVIRWCAVGRRVRARPRLSVVGPVDDEGDRCTR